VGAAQDLSQTATDELAIAELPFGEMQRGVGSASMVCIVDNIIGLRYGLSGKVTQGDVENR